MITDYSTTDNEYEYIIHISDIHIRLKNREEEYRTVFDKLYKRIDTNSSKNGLIVLTGDIFHDKVSLTPESIILCTELFINLSSRLKTIVIPGNHDGLLNSNERIDNISGVLFHKEIQNLYYFKNSGIYKFNNIIFGVCSIFDNIFIKASEIISKDLLKIALYHGGVGEVKISNLYKHKGEKTIEDFEGYDYALLGDIHTYQYLNAEKTIGYASSLISQNFSETDPYHGYLHWDLKNKCSRYEIIENDYHHKICNLDCKILTLDDEKYNITDDNDLNRLKKYMPKKGKVKIIIENDENNELYKYLKNQYKDVSWTEVNNTLLNKGKQESERLSNVDINLKDIIKDILKDKKIDESNIEFICNDIKNRKISKEKKGNNWKLLRLKISNLCLYGDNNEIDLLKSSKNDIILIHGQNNIGKSSIIDIISNILYNKMARRMNTSNKKVHDILNINKQEGYGEILFMVEDKMYMVIRKYKRKKNNEIKADTFLYYIEKSNEEVPKMERYIYGDSIYKMDLKTKGSSVNENIEELLGTYDDFIFMNIMLQFDNVSFRNMKQGCRKDLLNRLLDLDKYEEIRNDIVPIYDKYNEEYKELSKKIEYIDIKGLELSLEQKILSIREYEIDIANKDDSINTITLKINELNMNYTKLEKSDKNLDEMIKRRDNYNKIEFKLLDREGEILDNYTNEKNAIKLEELNTKLQELLGNKKTLYDIKYNFSWLQPGNPTTYVSGFQPSDVRLTSPVPGFIIYLDSFDSHFRSKLVLQDSNHQMFVYHACLN